MLLYVKVAIYAGWWKGPKNGADISILRVLKGESPVLQDS